MPAPRILLAGFAALAALTALLSSAGGAAADTPPADPLPQEFDHIRVVDLEGPIEPVVAAYIGRQARVAEEDGADCLLLRIDSPGGTVRDSMKVADLLLDLPDSLHVVAWVPERAYSGAAMVALACDEIVMGRNAHFGDAQPGIPAPEGWQPAGEKMESPLRAKLRAYAERNGYPVALAEAMVSDRIEVLKVRDAQGNILYVKGQDFRAQDPEAEVRPGVLRKDLTQVGPPVVREDELLTLTSGEALSYGFLRRRFAGGRAFPDDEEELLGTLKADDAKVVFAPLSFSEKASRVLLDLTGILSAIIALSLLLLLWQGPGVFTFVGGIALVLVLLINVTADQLHGFPLFLLLLGFLLLLAEIFVIPGFGIAGVLGVFTLGTGFLFLAAGATLGDTSGVTSDLAVDFGLQFVLTILLGMIAIFMLSRIVPAMGPGRRLVLTAPDTGSFAPTRVVIASVATGRRGTTASPLRPAGTATIDGRLVDVVTEGDWIPAEVEVEVVAVEGNRVTVRSLEPPDEERREV